MSYNPPPVTTPPPPPAGPCGGISCILNVGDGGIVAALNAARAAHGLQPISGWVVSSQAQNCALNGNNTPCGSNEMSTGVSGGPDGAQAVASWMSTSSANILLEPGTGPAGSGLYQFVAEIGFAYEAPTASNGGGYVAVLGIYADSPNFIANCP